MSVKEKPFLDSAANPGPLPGFLFANPFFSGVFAVIMSAIFGVVAITFVTVGYSGGEALEMFETARIGAFGGAGIAGVALALMAIVGAPKDQRLFLAGGFSAIALMVAADALWTDALRGRLESAPPVIRKVA